MTTLAEHFKTLDLSPDASRAEIKRAYRDLAKVWHPDRFPSDPRLRQKAESRFKAINNAYQEIMANLDRPGASTRTAPPPTPQSPPPQPKPAPPYRTEGGATPKSPRQRHSEPPTPPTSRQNNATNIWLGAAAVMILFIMFRSSDNAPHPPAAAPSDSLSIDRNESSRSTFRPSTTRQQPPVQFALPPAPLPIEPSLPQRERSAQRQDFSTQSPSKQAPSTSVLEEKHASGLPVASLPRSPSTYLDQRKQEDRERAKYWTARGYQFDPERTTAYMMDRKVEDIQRSAQLKETGHDFDPNRMTAYMMDRKVDDIQRAAYWKGKGYTFDPNRMTAYMMDRKVEDITRAQYWKQQGYDFDPNRMTAYSMDREAERRTKSR